MNETKDIVTAASRIHGAGSAIGFMLLLFVPLFIALLAFKSDEKINGLMGIVSFILAITCFVLFIMADKTQFQNTVFLKEGLWQRLSLLFMYLPLAFTAVKNMEFPL